MNDSERVYDEIIGPLENRMIGSIWRIVANAQDAEDAMQNALLVIWKRWERVITHPNPESLILKICIDAAYDATRCRIRTGKLKESPRPISEQIDSSLSPEDQLVQGELYREVLAA